MGKKLQIVVRYVSKIVLIITFETSDSQNRCFATRSKEASAKIVKFILLGWDFIVHIANMHYFSQNLYGSCMVVKQPQLCAYMT